MSDESLFKLAGPEDCRSSGLRNALGKEKWRDQKTVGLLLFGMLWGEGLH